MLKKLKWALRHASGNAHVRYYSANAQTSLDERHKKIVGLLSTGNDNLQRGRYVTSEMVDQKREQLLGSK